MHAAGDACPIAGQGIYSSNVLAKKKKVGCFTPSQHDRTTKPARLPAAIAFVIRPSLEVCQECAAVSGAAGAMRVAACAPST